MIEVEQKILAAKEAVKNSRSEVRHGADLKNSLQAKTNMEQTARVNSEIAKMRGLVEQLKRHSENWEAELAAWSPLMVQALGIQPPPWIPGYKEVLSLTAWMRR